MERGRRQQLWRIQWFTLLHMFSLVVLAATIGLMNSMGHILQQCPFFLTPWFYPDASSRSSWWLNAFSQWVFWAQLGKNCILFLSVVYVSVPVLKTQYAARICQGSLWVFLHTYYLHNETSVSSESPCICALCDWCCVRNTHMLLLAYLNPRV